MPCTSVNPVTNETIQPFPQISKDEMLSAIEQADAAYREWKNTSFDERKKVLPTLASQLRDRPDEFARLVTLEMGERISEYDRLILARFRLASACLIIATACR